MPKDSRKKLVFPLDSTIYVGDYLEQSVKKYMVMGHRFDDKFNVLFVREFDSLRAKYIHVADLGVPGFAYDDRPNMIHTTEQAAADAQKAGYLWFLQRH